MSDTKTIVRLCRHRSHEYFDIWKLRWNDTWKNESPVCLLKDDRLKDFNIIEFTQEPTRTGLYYISKKEARKCKPKIITSKLGRPVKMREVPFDLLREFEWEYPCVHLM